MTTAEKKQIADTARRLRDGMTVPGINDLDGWRKLRGDAATVADLAADMADALLDEADAAAPAVVEES